MICCRASGKEVLLAISQWENVSITSVPSAVTNATTAAGGCLDQGSFVSSSFLYFSCSSNTLSCVGFFHPHCEIQKLYFRCVFVNHIGRHCIFPQVSKKLMLSGIHMYVGRSRCNASYFFAMESTADTKSIITLLGRAHSQPPNYFSTRSPP